MNTILNKDRTSFTAFPDLTYLACYEGLSNRITLLLGKSNTRLCVYTGVLPDGYVPRAQGKFSPQDAGVAGVSQRLLCAVK